MERRKFIKRGAAVASLLSLGIDNVNAKSNHNIESISQTYKFNLKYAPHFGMFKNHAGKDPIDQLNFMADQGFTAISKILYQTGENS